MITAQDYTDILDAVRQYIASMPQTQRMNIETYEPMSLGPYQNPMAISRDSDSILLLSHDAAKSFTGYVSTYTIYPKSNGMSYVSKKLLTDAYFLSNISFGLVLYLEAGEVFVAASPIHQTGLWTLRNFLNQFQQVQQNNQSPVAAMSVMVNGNISAPISYPSGPVAWPGAETNPGCTCGGWATYKSVAKEFHSPTLCDLMIVPRGGFDVSSKS